MIQIRDVPDDLHQELKRRAAKMDLSLSDYLKQELSRLAERPSLEEWFDRVSKREPINVSAETIVGIIRAHRDA